MIADIFNLLLYQPLYNGLVFLASVVPYGDVGIAVIVLTVLIKIILFPLTHKTTKTQARMRSIEPEVKKVKEKYKKDKQEQARKTMELYQKHGINPFSGCSLFIIQIPIIIALYWVFWKGLTNGLDAELLYSFVKIPETLNMNFLGLIDMAGKSFTLAAIAGISQYFQMKYAMPAFGTEKKWGEKMTLKEEFMKSFQLQMKYGLPIFVFIIAYTISAAVALYWATSNIFSIGHELVVRRRASKPTSTTSTTSTTNNLYNK